MKPTSRVDMSMANLEGVFHGGIGHLIVPTANDVVAAVALEGTKKARIS